MHEYSKLQQVWLQDRLFDLTARSQCMMAESSADSWRGNAGTKGKGKRVSQPFEDVAQVKVNVGTFNLGLHQLQIESTRFPSSTLPNFRRIIARGFKEGDLHLLNLCEVGGHKQGLQAECIQPESIVDGILVKDEYGTSPHGGTPTIGGGYPPRKLFRQ